MCITLSPFEEELDLNKKVDEFSNKALEIGGIWQEMLKLAEMLEKNPFYVYPLKTFINRVEELSEKKDWPVSTICERLHNLLSNFWFPISSAASAIIPLDEQKRLVLKISSHLKKLYAIVPDEHEKFLEFDNVAHCIEKSIKSNLEIIEKKNLRVLKRQKRRIRVKEEWPQWKKDLITLIGVWGLLGRRDQPEYIMKSGVRSFYFFDLCRPFYDPRIREHFALLMQEGVEYFLKELKKEGMDTSDLLLIDKTYGEGPGTVLLSSLPFKQRYADMQSLPSTPWFDRIRGLSLETDEIYRPVVIDTLTTTGGTLIEILKRLEKMRCRPAAYIVLVDRSPKGLPHIKEVGDLPIFSLVSFQDLLEARILEPEILLGSIDQPIYLGLELKRDSTFEICKFYKKEGLYQDLRVRLFSLINKAFNIEGDRIFGKTRLSGDIATFRDIAVNILILSYNSLKNRFTFLSKLMSTEYIEYIESVEKHYSPVLSRMSLLLRSELEDTVHTSVELDHIVGIFATNWGFVLDYISECAKELNLITPKEKYSDQELKTLANIGVKLLEKVYGRTLESPGYTFHPEEAKKHLKRLYRIYESFNEITGKPYEEFLGEKFFEGLITSPEHSKHKCDKET